MPEGDTIHRTAATLRRALVGARLARFEAPRLSHPHPAPGVAITEVEARGKHLLIRFDDDHVLHTHLRMTGSWHVYRPGDRWQRPASTARVVLHTDHVVAVCFVAPVVELLDRAAEARHPALRRLGPDLTVAEPDLDEVLARIDRIADPATAIGDVLLTQSIASGIGNVYRSEVCFLHGVDPRRPVAEVDDATRRALYATASDLLRANLDTRRRTTVGAETAGNLWVYGRAGRPCRRCGSAIELTRSVSGRSEYRCPGCQPT